MSHEYLPSKIDPVRLLANSQELQGKILIKDMQRLCSLVASVAGEVAVAMQFGVDKQGIPFMRGHFASDVRLQCQRCLELFTESVKSDFSVALINSDAEVIQLPQSYEPLLLVDGMVLIHDFIEDELIVNLPIVPMHDTPACKVQLPLTLGNASEAEVEVKRENPFKVIECLRTKQDSKV